MLLVNYLGKEGMEYLAGFHSRIKLVRVACVIP
jgi:hypothetical protein